jgi:predicted AlkP superfamily pyrophosphatase or phosphodiesterase
MPHRLTDAGHAAPARRVVLLVLDGLRADLVGDPRFPHLRALRDASAHTLRATTVSPSVTAVAMTSLLSGVSPQTHGVTSDRFRVPTPRVPLETIPQVVRQAGLSAQGYVRQVPWLIRPLARRIVAALGVSTATFATANAHALLTAALPALREQREGFIVIHWPDCDAIGHRTGWMSAAYLAAVTRMDSALGVLRRELAATREDTLLIALADHGGGGRIATHHDSDHPLDVTIPIFLDGAGVHTQRLRDGHSILDVSATVLWALGLTVPAQYGGTPLRQAFAAPADVSQRMAASAA